MRIGFVGTGRIAEAVVTGLSTWQLRRSRFSSRRAMPQLHSGWRRAFRRCASLPTTKPSLPAARSWRCRFARRWPRRSCGRWPSAPASGS